MKHRKERIVPRNLPALRRKNDRGKIVGIVTLTDYHEHQRRDFYCGPWDEPKTRQRYTELILEWQASDRRWPCQVEPAGMTINVMLQLYWRWAEIRYGRSERITVRTVRLMLEERFGDLPAKDFGPKKLRILRDSMIARGWNRNYVNQQIHRTCSIFKWAAGQELLSVTVYQGLKTVESLEYGATTAPEPEEVEPIDDAHVDPVKPYVSRQVWAIVELQRFTAARPGELVTLRKCDVDQNGDIWQAKISKHKTARHGKKRTLFFGPKAQAVLAEWLMRPDEAYLFSPAEAENERIELASQNRKTPDHHGNTSLGRRRSDIGEHYTTASYRRAIDRAIELANVAAGGTKDNRVVKHWHPHQLRHSMATEIDRRFGSVEASVVLGHSSAAITNAVYIHRNKTIAEDVMRKMG